MSIRSTIKTMAIAGISAQMILVSQFSVAAQAEVVSTEAAIAKYAAQADRDFLMAELQKAEVRDKMIELGVDPAEAEARIAALSDAEIRQLIESHEADLAGAGVIGTLFTVLVVLLLLDVLCITDIFSFARCAIR